MRPLPAVLLDLHENRATGQLTLRRGRVIKTVDFLDGNPVSTASTQRDETLGQFLVTTGVITEAQHRQAVERTTARGGKLGEALVAVRALTLEQLIDQLARQARHKLVQALRWPQGAWRFDESFEPVEGVQLRTVELVLGGLRETAAVDLARLGRLDGVRVALTERGARLRHELERAFGARAIALLERTPTTEELERACADRMLARLAIDAMLLCAAVTTVAPDGGATRPPPLPPPRPRRPSLRPAPPPPPDPAAAAPIIEDHLFELLFDDVTLPDDDLAPSDDAIPLEHSEPEDSGIVTVAELAAANIERAQTASARQALIAELQRSTHADHYAVLKVDRRAPSDDIEHAYRARRDDATRGAAVLTAPQDRARLDELLTAYAAARAALVDDHRRADYDRELAGGELVQVPPAIATELEFRAAEELMARGEWEQAIGYLRAASYRSPNEADYHAALGWAEWHAGRAQPDVADSARVHLDIALTINPDHPAAHYYKGQLEAALKSDEALFHLERAIDLDPQRGEALAAIETLLVGRGELRRLERALKRVLFRMRGKGTAAEVKAWVQLARLYFEHLDDPASGAAAIASARAIAPDDRELSALIGRAERRPPAPPDPARTGWGDALGNADAGAALVRATADAGHPDVAFLAASTMVALGTADETTAAHYEQHRGAEVVLPTTPLGRDHWAMLRHADDGVELCELVDLLAPAVHALAPMTLVDSDLDDSIRLDDADLPPTFARLRTAIAGVLGVAPPAVYPRVQLGTQIHVIAADPAVLVVGDDALTAPARPELVFALARALTFLRPGRAVGASRPGRVLRAIVMATFREASGTRVGGDDPLAASATAALAALTAPARTRARAAATRLLARGGRLNLSVWARSLTRTADRVGMLLCGDVPTAFAAAGELGELDRDLKEFAYSEAHVQLRAQLGLSRG